VKVNVLQRAQAHKWQVKGKCPDCGQELSRHGGGNGKAVRCKPCTAKRNLEKARATALTKGYRPVVVNPTELETR
jgi:DNA-directed RNA polymerase subunit RPC12/RpoP